MQTVTWHLVSHHTCHNHPGVDPCNPERQVSPLSQTRRYKKVKTRSTHRRESVCCCHSRGLSGGLWSAPCPGPCRRCCERGTLSSLGPRLPPCRHLQWSRPGRRQGRAAVASRALVDKVHKSWGGGTQTLKTRCFSLSVSNSVYMVLSMETTCIGVMWLQMRVNPTTSLKRMVTSGNTWRREIRKLMRGRERRGREALVGQICVYAFNAKIQRDLTVNLIFTVAKSLKET